MKKAIAYVVLSLGALGLCVIAYVVAGVKGVCVFLGLCVCVIACIWAIDAINF